jgi:hypothetical protein
MSNVVPFKRPSLKEKARSLKEKARRRTLCSRGFHKWQIDQKQRFDVKQGRLVTVRRCERCGATKSSLT